MQIVDSQANSAPAKPLHILYIITNLGIGGAERQVLDLASYMHKLGHKVTLINMQAGNAWLDELPFEYIELNLQRNLKSFWQTLQVFNQFVINNAVDVVHSHMFHANIFARIAKGLIAKPFYLVCTAHNSNEGGLARMLAYRLTNWLGDIFTNVSQDAVDSFIKKGAATKKQLQTVYNGFSLNKFQSKNFAKITELKQQYTHSPSDFIWVKVARLVQCKGHTILLNAFAQVLKNQPNSVLWLVGDGEEKQALLAQAKQLGIESKIYFLGIRHDVVDLLHASDAFVLASFFEGMPLVVSEALLSSKAVIMTNCSAAKALILHKDWVVPINDAQALAKAMLNYMQHTIEEPKQTKALIEQNRQHIIKQFSLEAISVKWLSFYNMRSNKL